MSLRGIKLVTFDATNTLLKFRVPPWQHYAVVAKEFGFNGTGDDVKGRLLGNFKVMWNKYPNYGKDTISWEDWWTQVVRLTFDGHLPAGADVSSIANRLIEEYKTSKCWCAAEGGDRLVSLLRGQQISIGVISNFDPRLADILQSVNIYKCFDFVLTSYEVGYSKPDERIFKHAMQTINNWVQPSECVHIGDDMQKDYDGARAAGWHALLLAAQPPTERPPAPKHVFNSLDELSVAIEQEKLKL